MRITKTIHVVTTAATRPVVSCFSVVLVVLGDFSSDVVVLSTGVYVCSVMVDVIILLGIVD